MRTKTCGDCKWYDHNHLLCVVGGDVKPTERAKDCFVSAKPTNGEKIWQSGYDAVITFAKTWMEKFTCWAEAEAWLNAPADNTESEVEDE